MKTKHVAAALCVWAASAFSVGSAIAGATYGVGVGWTFGGPKPTSGPTVGLKVFSNDREERAAASLGVDYVFKERGFRPNVGVAYLGKNDIYLDANVGYSFTQKGLDFGLGTGYVDTKR